MLPQYANTLTTKQILMGQNSSQASTPRNTNILAEFAYSHSAYKAVHLEIVRALLQFAEKRGDSIKQCLWSALWSRPVINPAN